MLRGESFNEESAPSGGPLGTEPVELPGIGDLAYTFQSPEGGYDHVWVLTNGYRLLVTDENTSDVPGAADTLDALALEVAPKI